MPYVHVDIDVGEFSDRDLIDELEDRGYIIVGQANDPMFKLRQSFLLDTPEQFRKFVVDLLAAHRMPV
jgi:hypothetical protein